MIVSKSESESASEKFVNNIRVNPANVTMLFSVKYNVMITM